MSCKWDKAHNDFMKLLRDRELFDKSQTKLVNVDEVVKR